MNIITTQQPNILSLKFSNQIQKACLLLPEIDLQYFAMYIIFNNGKKFILSNIFHMLADYYHENLHEEDYSFKSHIIANANYYLCDKTASVSVKFKKMLEERFNVHRAYYIIRSCPEATFIFGAIKNSQIDNHELFYAKTYKNFENFCLKFICSLQDLIIDCNPDYKNSFIFTSSSYRKAVITGGYQDNMLTEREIDCLNLLSRGNSTKEIAKFLNISSYTVETHAKNIRSKLNCSTITEAVVEGIHRGVVGSVNKWPKCLIH